MYSTPEVSAMLATLRQVLSADMVVGDKTCAVEGDAEAGVKLAILSLFSNVLSVGWSYQPLKQLILIAHNILTPKSDPIGYILLQALRAYMELDMYAGLSLHMSSTLQAGWTKQSIFIALIEVYLLVL